MCVCRIKQVCIELLKVEDMQLTCMAIRNTNMGTEYIDVRIFVAGILLQYV